MMKKFKFIKDKVMIKKTNIHEALITIKLYEKKNSKFIQKYKTYMHC